MKKILLCARDPGGANTIIPLVEKLSQKYEVLLYGKDVALEKYKQYQLEGMDIVKEVKDIEKGEISRFLQAKKPDFIITGTSADDYTEKFLWSEGKKLGIPSFAILDQWVNYGIRFSKYGVSEIEKYWKDKTFPYLPTRIMVMDSYAKECMKQEGISEEIITVSGQPYFDQFLKDMAQITDKTVERCKEQWNARKDEIVMVFASEPISKTYQIEEGEDGVWGYTEKAIFQGFRNTLEKVARQKKQHVRVMVRPHPKEDRVWWEIQLTDAEYVSYGLDSTKDSKVTIQAADVICGMSSMFLIESAMCQKPILSIQIGLKQENSFILEKKGVLQSILEESVLEEALGKVLERQYPICNIDIPQGADDRIISEMERWI